MLRSPDVQGLLDRCNISYFRQTDLYNPGYYVNTEDFCLLENSITIIYVDGEEVALEVCDPLIESEVSTKVPHETSRQEQSLQGAKRSVQGTKRSAKGAKQSTKGAVARDTQEMTKNFQNPEASAKMTSHQVFVYARVLEKSAVAEGQTAVADGQTAVAEGQTAFADGQTAVAEGQSTVYPWSLSYRVDIGFGRITEVPAIRLYKIPADEEEPKAEADEDDDDETPTAKCAQLTSHSDPVTKDAAVNDVKSCLEAAFLILRDRRLQLGLLKRLCLKWHPCLNCNIICPQITEIIKQHTTAHNSCAANETYGGHRLASIPSLQPAPTAAFFDRVRERGRLYASQMLAARGKTSDSSSQQAPDSSSQQVPDSSSQQRSDPSSRQTSDPSSQQTSDPSSQQTSDPSSHQKRTNPQPGEGRRWLSQAFDYHRTALNTGAKNSWLHCLMCHQATETALKAVLFHNDADSELLHPSEKADLLCLAKAIGDEDLTRTVNDLEQLTGKLSKMLRPSVEWGPQIPANLYTVHTARAARKLTEKVLDMAVSLTT